jgi:hypothetical protein
MQLPMPTKLNYIRNNMDSPKFYMLVYIPNYIGGTAAIGYRQYDDTFWLDDGDIIDSEKELRLRFPHAIFLTDSDVHSMFNTIKEILKP